MSDRDIIHTYIKSLSKYLSRLEKRDADDVIREIESHIYDVLESNEEAGTIVPASEILEGFGDPRELAAQYVDHILEGTPPPKGFNAIQSVKTGVTWGLVLATAIFGYSVSVGSIFWGLYKLFLPDEVGIWVTADGNSYIIGGSNPIPPGAEYEIVGWWLVPIALCLGIAIGYLTKRLVSTLRQQI